jgi:hypothetical protein
MPFKTVFTFTYPLSDSKVELMLRHQTALGLPTDFAKAAEPCDGCMQGGMRKPSVKNKTTAETHEPIEPGSKIFSVVGVDLDDGVKDRRRQMGVLFACIGAGGCDYSWLYFAQEGRLEVEDVEVQTGCRLSRGTEDRLLCHRRRQGVGHASAEKLGAVHKKEANGIEEYHGAT